MRKFGETLSRDKTLANLAEQACLDSSDLDVNIMGSLLHLKRNKDKRLLLGELAQLVKYPEDYTLEDEFDIKEVMVDFCDRYSKTRKNERKKTFEEMLQMYVEILEGDYASEGVVTFYSRVLDQTQNLKAFKN